MSIDTPASQKAWAEKLGLPYALLADPNRDWLRQIGVLLPEVSGIRDVCTRAAFVIGPERTLRWLWQGPDARVLPVVADVLQAAQQV